MLTGKRRELAPYLQTLFSAGSLRDLTDGQILEWFACSPSDIAELAFATLVERHGPMVLSVCRGILFEKSDVEDAFQATFLVLFKKARQLWTRDSLGPWLYQVAHRTASCARSAAARRRRHERLAAERTAATAADHDAFVAHESRQVLHEEINRLPGRYRMAILLCDLEGQTCEQAARAMGCPVGTLKCWRARGRERLRSRLSGRGFARSLVFSGPAAFTDAVPKVLVERAVQAMMQLATNGGAVEMSSAAAVHLARGVLSSLFVSRILTIAIASVLLGALTVGVAVTNQPGVAVDKAVIGDENRTQPANSVTPGNEPGSSAGSHAARA